MKIETLNERIAKAEEKINKKNGTIQKKVKLIEKKTAQLEKQDAQERRWTEFDIIHLEEDVERLKKEVAEAESSLMKYQDMLSAEIEKANSRNVTAILEFLENWKAKVMEYYTDKFDRYLVAREKHFEEAKKHANWWNNGGWRDVNAEEINKAYREAEKAYRKRWADIERYGMRKWDDEEQTYSLVFNRERLQSELDAEANAKYDDIIERTNAICGTITDARGLWVGDKGDLDGIIVGERGTAKVQTIGAGGYNIQCFHFRTLVHEFK